MIKIEFEIIKVHQDPELGNKCTGCIFKDGKTYGDFDCEKMEDSELYGCMTLTDMYIYKLKEIK